MCGRARQSLSSKRISSVTSAEWASIAEEERYEPRENIGPGMTMAVLVSNNMNKPRTLSLRNMKWGLIPSWQKVGEKIDFFRMFNARIETVEEKHVFSRLLKSRRCGKLRSTQQFK